MTPNLGKMSPELTHKGQQSDNINFCLRNDSEKQKRKDSSW
jgi:hypothetical protein